MTVAGLSAQALVFPNVESVVAAFLQGRSELSGISIGSVLPTGFNGTQSAIVLSRLGGRYPPDELLDRAEVRIDSYAADKVSAQTIALSIRGVLPLMVPAALLNGVVMTDVTEIQGPLFSIDHRNSDANRYIMKYLFTVVVTTKPA